MRIGEMLGVLIGSGTRAKKSGMTVVAAVLAGALIAVASPSTANAVSSPHGQAVNPADVGALQGPFYLINRNGKYLAPSGNLLVVSTTGGPSRYLNTVGDNGWLTLEHDATGRNVGTNGNGTANGTRGALVVPSGNFTQDWGVLPYQSGPYFRLQNRAVTSRCLGISGGSSGTNVAIFNCEVANNQLWTLVALH